MSPTSKPWRYFLLLGLLLAGLAVGVRNVADSASKAVSFVFTDLDGRSIRLEDYRGKWVLASFWATWCPLCKIQVPTLNALNLRPDFRVIGIALDYSGDKNAVREAAIESNLHYDAQIAGGSRHDPNSAFRQVGPVDFFPTSYLYDPTGEIVMFSPGQLRMGRVLSFMEKWYAERGGTRQPTFSVKTEKLAAFLRNHYGARGAQAYAEWKRMLDHGVSATPMQKLVRVNDFFNRRIQAADGQQVWGRPDYWATPGELLGVGRGDSVDIAIAKYFTLLALNIAPEKLHLIYVKSRGEAQTDSVHMVLAYYENSGVDPLLLDAASVLPAAKRPDLQPVFSFNSLGAWDETTKAVAAGTPGHLATWEDTLRRARAEGFE